MRRDLIALRLVVACCAILLCLAQASAAASSSFSKSRSKSNQRSHPQTTHKTAAATGAHRAPAASTTRKSAALAPSRTAIHSAHSTRGAASTRSANARTRTTAHAAPAVLRTNTHHRTAAAERRLAHLREVNFQARQRARIEIETEDRSGLIEPPTPSLRFELAVAMPSPLRGSHQSLLRQNTRSEDEGLERILDDDDLNDRIAEGLLVPVPTTVSLAINGSLPVNRRYCRPWTSSFLTDLAHAHAAEFKSPLMVTSAVRTVEYQRKLMGVNGNAAPAEGDVASPHLTGGSIDIAKSSMSKKEIAWMRRWLLPLQDAGQIDVEEEFKQSCFHITVYETYEALPSPLPQPRPHVKRRTVKNEVAVTEPATRGE
jgi:hypothetical protein